MSTYFPTTESARNNRKWWLVDATGLTLGRMASEVARILSGKNQTDWTPHTDTGDHVVIVNAEKIVLTGRKLEQKLYRRHTGYPGGLKEIRADKFLQKDPARMVQIAVTGMLPKNRIGRQMAKKLRVVAGPDHPHVAQAPEPTDLGLRRADTDS